MRLSDDLTQARQERGPALQAFNEDVVDGDNWQAPPPGAETPVFDTIYERSPEQWLRQRAAGVNPL